MLAHPGGGEKNGIWGIPKFSFRPRLTQPGEGSMTMTLSCVEGVGMARKMDELAARSYGTD